MTTSKNKAYKDQVLFIKATNPNFWTPFVVTTIILLLVVAFITDYNLRQSDRVIGSQIAERGKRTILIYEAITLGEIHFTKSIDKQSLTQSLGNQKDFAFLAVTDNDGKVLVHSNIKQTNKNINIHSLDASKKSFPHRIKELLRDSDEEGTSWGFVEVNNVRLFIVHRIFAQNREQNQIQEQETNMPRNEVSHGDVPLENASHGNLSIKNASLEKNTKHIFAAIQPTPLQDALIAYRRNSFLMSFWVIGISCFSLLFFSLLYRLMNNRKRMTAAENTIAAMHEEVKRLESEIQKQEKFVAIGNLAAAVAHEIRNPLSSIKGYATYFASLFQKESENQKAAQIMISEVERLNRVIGDLIGVSRPTDIKTKQVAMRTLIDNIVQLLSQDAKQLNIELNVNGTSKPAYIDPDRFSQALINIVLNSIEAFKEDDFINQVKSAKIDINLTETKENIVIDITDNGHGMDEQTLKRIFDPYFTTKSQGTGLGLVNSSKIIEAHGGSISVESQKSLGATFTIRIPKKSINRGS